MLVIVRAGGRHGDAGRECQPSLDGDVTGSDGLFDRVDDADRPQVLACADVEAVAPAVPLRG